MIKQVFACAVTVSAVFGLAACTSLRVTSDVNQPLASTVKCQSFDWAGSFHGSSDSLRSTVANPVNEARLRAAIQSNLRETTTRVLASLTPREERILRMRFGIGMNKDHTLEEVGQQFSVTRERIRQIEAKALRKLKHPSRSSILRSFLDN